MIFCKFYCWVRFSIKIRYKYVRYRSTVLEVSSFNDEVPLTGTRFGTSLFIGMVKKIWVLKLR